MTQTFNVLFSKPAAPQPWMALALCLGWLSGGVEMVEVVVLGGRGTGGVPATLCERPGCGRVQGPG